MLRLFNVFASHNATGYTWLGTDGWTESVHIRNSSLSTITRGMLGLRLHTQPVPGFDEFLRSRSPSTTQFQDPFIIRYWEETFGCYLTERGKSGGSGYTYTERCAGNESLTGDDLLYDSPLVSAVVDAVEVVARALHELLGCDSYHTDGGSGESGNGRCMVYQDGVPKDLMLQCMKNVNFTGYSEYRIDFTDNGDLASEAW